MIKIENVEVCGWEAAIRGMRSPLNSWDKSDSGNKPIYIDGHLDSVDYCVGENDLALMRKLAAAGSVHGKYRRMITVTLDITAPLYFWKEFDTYKVGTVRNSCSTMHKITAKGFEIDDFSREHLIYDSLDENAETTIYGEMDEPYTPDDMLDLIMRALNTYRNAYLNAKTKPMKSEQARQELMKKYWWQIIQLLPSSYNQRATVQLNYEVLAGMYHYRNDHKLDEWREFCKWIESLPYSELITGKTP